RAYRRLGFTRLESEWDRVGCAPEVERVLGGGPDLGSQRGHWKDKGVRKARVAGIRDRVVQPDLEDGRGRPPRRSELRKMKSRVTRRTDRLDRSSSRDVWRPRPGHRDGHPLLQEGLEQSLELRGVRHDIESV